MLRTLLVTAIAVVSTLVAVPTAGASPTAVECRSAGVVEVSDTSTRVGFTGVVRCTERVFRIGVTIEAFQDGRAVAGARNACDAVASCVAQTAVANVPGRQQWCVVVNGSYVPSPTGPAIIVIPPVRACAIG
jgi:hypothetical protein